MFIITMVTYLFSNNINNTVNEKDEEKETIIESLIYNFKDFMNDGINKTSFKKIIGHNYTKYKLYDQIINTLTDKFYKLSFNDIQITDYFNQNQNLYSIDPIIRYYFNSNKELFKEIKQIFIEIGPNFCKAFNLNYNTLMKLFNYIFINEENDDVKIKNIIKILKITNKQIQKMQTTLSFFDGKITIFEFFKSINCETQYLKFVESVEKLKIPKNDEKFISFNVIKNVTLNGIDLIKSINVNFISKPIKTIIKPLFNTHYFNPFNLFEKSLFERASEIYEVIDIIHSYSYCCPISETQQKPNMKCFIYSFLESIIYEIYKDRPNSMKFKNEIFYEFKSMIKDISNKKFNITVILIDKCGFSRENAENIYKTIYDINDPKMKHKALFELLIQDTTLQNNQTTEDTKSIFDSFESFQDIFKIEKLSDMKTLFEYLNISQYFIYYSDFVIDLNRFETFPDFVDHYKKEISEQINLALNESPINEYQIQTEMKTVNYQDETQKEHETYSYEQFFMDIYFLLGRNDYIILFILLVHIIYKEFEVNDDKTEEEKKDKAFSEFAKVFIGYITIKKFLFYLRNN